MAHFYSFKHFANSMWYLPNRGISPGFKYAPQSTSFQDHDVGYTVLHLIFQTERSQREKN
jgi:hypothetical protein